MDPFTIAMALGQLVPGIVKLVTGSDKAEAVAGKVVDIAKAVTGKATGEEALDAIKVDPNLALQLRMKIDDNRVELERLAFSNAGQVNETMRAEAQSEHWPTYSWRPAIGFSVALAVFLSVLTVFLAYGSVIFYGKTEGLQHLPGILAAVAGIIGVVSPVLGIASWFRGRMQADPSTNTINKG